jgi:2',3'-cyclic-nucleotide 2'-phosphodiesterase (5'-nucleotidase family)
MKNLFTIISLLLIATNAWSQSTIALWNYDGITGTPATPTANVGSGTSLKIGSFVVASAATGMDPFINDGCGTQNGVNPGAWAITANPGLTNESSGVQFSASTVGYSNIVFTWDQRSSSTAVNTVRLQYTLDGTTWTNFTMTVNNTTFCLGELNDGRFQNSTADASYRRISVNLSSITGANNNANFGVRILAAHYQTSGAFRATVVQTNTASNTGSMRFDNVSFTTQAANVIPTVSIAAASNVAKYAESIGLVNVPITVANANSTEINLTFGLSVYSDATETADYSWTNTLTIPANTNGISNLPITIIDDLLAEKAERIVVKLLSGTNATISATSNYQIIFIKDNDYVAPTSSNELNLSLLTSFSNGATGTNSAEIVSFDPTVDRLYIANSIGRKLDIINFSNPSSPQLISSISMVPYGNINSVTTNNGLVALAIENIDPQANGSVVFLNANGEFIKQVAVGAMPDMITFNKTFTKILTANEGEPNITNTVDPEGSVSIIDLSPGIANLTDANVTNIGFTTYNSQRASLVSQGIRVFSSSLTVAQDLEPEYITISDDNTKAFVGIQEANALLTIDLTNNSIISLTALGYSSYGSGSNNAMDASDQSGEILITGNLPIKGAYMPDALAFGTIAGQGFIFSANEGDSRELTTAAIIDANRISSTTFANLDATAFPDAAILKNSSLLGRLSALKYSGDTDGDGDYDELHVMGGRSFSIWNASTGALVYDSKDLIEQIISKHPVFSAIFNASNTTGTPSLKNRSDDKGPEVEGIAFQMISGKPYAFVSLERVGGIMIFNVENPTNPIYVGYANNRSTTVSGPDLGAEGIITISAEDSPNGNNIVILANEISSTLSIYQLNSCATAAGGVINASSNVICSGSSTTLSIPGSTGSTYQWQLNGQAIQNATGTQYSASSAGSYSVLVNSSILSCSGVSASKNIIAVSPISNSVSASINSGQTYTFGSQNLTSPGTYNNVFASVNNCDSTVTLNLTVNPENYGDTIVFDLNQGVYSSENGVNYFTYPVKIKSTYTAINSFDFWFKFNESKLTFVSSNSNLNGLDVFSNFNSNNHYLSSTASMPSISNTIPANTNIMELKFIVNGPCPEVNTNDFFNSNSLINGVICNHRFSPGIPRTAVINTTTIAANNPYTWSVTGQTYTTSGLITGTTTNCVTEILDLTITTEVNLSISENTGSEAAGTILTVTATASAPVNGVQSVSLGVSGTDITAGDYTLSNSTITIPAGQTTGSVTFTVVNDNVVEAAETAVLTISNPSSGIALGTTTTQNVAISDYVFKLQILHASDFEASVEAVLDAPRFAAIVDTLEETYPNTIRLSSGDNYIPGPFLSSGGDPTLAAAFKTAYESYYNTTFTNPPINLGSSIGRADISIMNFIGIEASALGNHEFDLGTNEIRTMIGGAGTSTTTWFGAQFPYLSSNLNFSGDGNLSPIATTNRLLLNTAFKSNPTETAAAIASKLKLAPSTIIIKGGQKIGIVGATTQVLASISSPGATTVVGGNANDMNILAGIIQPVVNSLIADGCNKIILLSHLQQIAFEQDLATKLSGVDIIISAGSNTLLADSNDRLRLGDVAVGTYPFLATDLTGKIVPLVNTDGNYKYVGRLVVDFDSDGNLIPSSIDNAISGVYATDQQGLTDAWGANVANAFATGTKGYRVQLLTTAIGNVITTKDGNLFGKTSVFLEGRRNFVRTEETNLGNITSEANLWLAKFYDPTTVISIKNGGGIRSAIGNVIAVGSDVTLVPPIANPSAGKQSGDISQLDIENSLRFNNTLSLVTLTATGMRSILERAVSATTATATPGQFAQVSGVRYSYDFSLPANSRILNAVITDNNGNVIDTLVVNGITVGNLSRTFRVVTLTFLVGGGDGYPFNTLGTNRVDLNTVPEQGPAFATFTTAGSEQDAFAEYMKSQYSTTPYGIDETPLAQDCRIQRIPARADNVLPPNPGTNGTLVICSGSTVTQSQLFAALGGTPATGGTWSPTPAGEGVYTYMVTSPSCSGSSSTTVMVVNGTQAVDTITQTAVGSYTWANNGQTYTVSGTYTGVVENCIAQVLNLTITTLSANLSLDVFLDGYYINNSNPSSMRPARYNNLVESGSINTGSSTDVDIITVELRSPSNLDVVAYSVSPILQANGSVQCVFPAAAIGATYYIVVNHRSSLPLWSANPVTMSASTALNFSNNITNVYTDGSISPMKTLVSGLYASRLGELIEDGYLDGMDYSAFESDAYSSAYENLYLLDSDLNGDSYVDASDFAVYDFNSQLGSYEQRPY